MATSIEYISEPDSARPPSITLDDMLASQCAALDTVKGALRAIAVGADIMADALRRGATLHYAAAGSSGLMALADAAELPGTFGINQGQIVAHMAGGAPTQGIMPGATEDSIDDAQRDADSIAHNDVAIVVSASGTTPYALAFAETARARGARVISISNTPGSTLLQQADVAITLPTDPEVVEGSTRLGAGTAQKVALNMMSTQVGILLGHVHAGLMVNLKPDNTKLRNRSAHIVRRISGVTAIEAQNALAATRFNTKAAILVASGATRDRALALLDKHAGLLSACLTEITSPSDAGQRMGSQIKSKGETK